MAQDTWESHYKEQLKRVRYNGEHCHCEEYLKVVVQTLTFRLSRQFQGNCLRENVFAHIFGSRFLAFLKKD